MRLIKTFILRLYVDLEMKEQICGDLQALPGRKTFPFKNNVELLNLIRQLSNEEAKDLPDTAAQNENDPDLTITNHPAK
jgi:hypothetical protein